MMRVNILILIAMLFLALGCEKTSPNHLQKIKKENSIRVGTLAGPKHYYLGGSGELGFEYELAKAFADTLGVKLKIVPYFNTDTLFSHLEQGKVDLIAAGQSYHPSRRDKFRFGPTYRLEDQRLVYKQGKNRPRAFSDLSGPVTVVAQSSQAILLKSLQEDNPELKIKQVNNKGKEEILQNIIDGEVEYSVVDSSSLALFRRYHPNLSVAFTIVKNEQISWVVKASDDDSLYAVILRFFIKAKKNNLLTTLEEKYFGHIEDFNYVNTVAFVAAVEKVLPKYQIWFEQYARQNALDWRLLASMSYQESMWKPRAKSPTGVRGIMMLTRSTAKQVGVKNRLEPEQNIRGGALYLRQLIDRMPDKLKEPDRTWYALASYNVGLGHVRDAMRLTELQGSDPLKWAEVKKRLPLLTKKRFYRDTRFGFARGDVAVIYVDNIRRYYDALLWLDENKQEVKINTQDGQ